MERQISVSSSDAIRPAEVVFLSLEYYQRARRIYEPWGLALSRTGLHIHFASQSYFIETIARVLTQVSS
jgi:spermidine synthase